MVLKVDLYSDWIARVLYMRSTAAPKTALPGFEMRRQQL